MSRTTVTIEIPSFIRRGKHELSTLLKQVRKCTPESITYLNSVVVDEKADPKLRVHCADILANLEVKITKEIVTDTFNRQIAEFRRVGGGSGGLQEGNTGERLPLPPRKDFSTIQTIE